MKMKRKIKIGKYWLGVNELETLTDLLKNQETTDKDEVGMYELSSNESTIHYRVNLYYDIIIDRIEVG